MGARWVWPPYGRRVEHPSPLRVEAVHQRLCRVQCRPHIQENRHGAVLRLLTAVKVNNVAHILSVTIDYPIVAVERRLVTRNVGGVVVVGGKRLRR